MAKKRKSDSSLTATIEEADALYSRGDEAWFSMLADDATIYSINSDQPFHGREAYESHFTKVLTGSKRKLTVMQRQSQVMGNTAVVTQTLCIEQDGVIANVRQSVVWGCSSESTWKIQHLHTAMIGTPSAAKPATGMKALRVLNERIATVAAVVGVAQ